MTNNVKSRPDARAGAAHDGNGHPELNDTLFARVLRALSGKRILTHILLIGFGFVMLYPILWMISSSLKPEELIFREPGLWPSSFTFDNFSNGWDALRYPFSHYFLNSAIITGASIVGNLVACSLAAYAFARLEFPFKKFWFA